MGETIARYIALIRRTFTKDYELMYREPGGPLQYKFLVPGSAHYSDVLWDWDSWLSDVALRQILREVNSPEAHEKALPYEQGCILNYLSWTGGDGWMPIAVTRNSRLEDVKPKNIYEQNMHKPCLAQHAAFLVREAGGDAEWLHEKFENLQYFLNNYRNHHRHPCGLYFWQTDFAIGVDDDPCIFYRPPRSCGSIYLNSMMYRELLAMAYLCERLGLDEIGRFHAREAETLKTAINEICWDERDGCYYNVDFNLLPVDRAQWLHRNQPRDYDALIMRMGVWSSFMAMWSGVATPPRARRMARGHIRNPRTFNAPYGIRTLSKMEKMYNLRASGNPSTWRGPIWGVANYMTFRGLVNYGLAADARDIAEKTIRLFGRDLERFGALHEYYQPENGEPILNRGFQNWNYLVLNMIVWLEGGQPVTEF
ncbi:MAG: glycoside hydrolase family 37 [bacterium]|nr:glycoside hydrolase family 37 [bacterium]